MSEPTPKAAPAAPAAAAEQLFVLRRPSSFWWTVRVPVPDDDTYLIAVLKCLFRWVDQAEFDRMQGKGLKPGEAAPTDAEIVQRVLVGWSGLKDEDGEPVPYSDEARDQLMAHTLVRSAVLATYFAVMSGVAARKNG